MVGNKGAEKKCFRKKYCYSSIGTAFVIYKLCSFEQLLTNHHKKSRDMVYTSFLIDDEEFFKRG